MTERILCVWLPNWPIQRVQNETAIAAALEIDANATLSQEDLAATNQVDHGEVSVRETPPVSATPGRPAAPTLLWRQDPRRGRLVAACCNQARQRGVTVGMPIAQATELVTAPSPTGRQATAASRDAVVVARHDVQTDNRRLRQLVQYLQRRITPMMSMETLDDRPWAGHPRHQPESLLGEIHGAAHLFGGESGCLHETARLLQTLGLQPQLAIADSVGAAWALAHDSRQRSAIDSSEKAVPPNGVNCHAIVSSGDIREAIGPLAIETLRIDTVTAATLRRLGVEQIDSLLQLPRDGLAVRLGSHLIRRIEQVLAERAEVLQIKPAPADLSTRLTLEYPTDDRRIIEDRMTRLVTTLASRLRQRQQGALRISCQLDSSEGQTIGWQIGLFAPSADGDHLQSLILHQLENQSLECPVERLSLSATLCGPLCSTQASLFDRGDGLNDAMSGSAISRLIDTLSGRLGCDAVVGVEMKDNPLPERCFGVFPLAGADRRRLNRMKRTTHRWSHSSRSAIGRPGPEDAMRRPLVLYPQPRPLAVAFQPRAFRHTLETTQLPRWIKDPSSGWHAEIQRHWGPERIETGWWKGPSVRRDYFRVETASGQWLWIYRTLRKPYRWWLHGKFE